MFFKGCFNNNTAKRYHNLKEEFENYLTHNKIVEYLNKYGFSDYADQFLTEYENDIKQ